MDYRKYGAAGLGVDIEAGLVQVAEASARQANLQHLVTFRHVISFRQIFTDSVNYIKTLDGFVC